MIRKMCRIRIEFFIYFSFIFTLIRTEATGLTEKGVLIGKSIEPTGKLETIFTASGPSKDSSGTSDDLLGRSHDSLGTNDPSGANDPSGTNDQSGISDDQSGTSDDQSGTTARFDPRIIGGQTAETGLLPYQVSIQMSFNGIHFCGGSIISEYHVLSAAHCFPYFDAEDILVWVGGRNLSDLDQGFSAEVEQILLHDYDESVGRQNDIAILKLKYPLNFTENVQKIPLNSAELEDGTECVVSGWGITKDNQSEMYNQDLFYVNVTLLDRGECQENYGKLKKPVNVTESMICAGHPNGSRDACRGDSGGPLVCGGKLTGIVSFGAGCGLRKYPGVYTDVRSFVDWISNVIGSIMGTNAAVKTNNVITNILVSILLVVRRRIF